MTTNRLGYDDEVFLRAATVLDTPVVGQTAWRFPTYVPVEAVQAVVDRLAAGPLNRMVVRPTVPGARSRFVRASVAEPVRVHPEPIAPEEVVAWLDATLALPLDPVSGPTWAFFLAHTTDGRTVVASNVSHIVADGGLNIAALIAAATGETLPQLPVDDLAAAQVTVWDEVRDAATMLGRAGRGLLRSSLSGSRPPTSPAQSSPAQSSRARPIPPPRPDDDVVHDVPFVAVDCPTADWYGAARVAGGTANGLVVALTTEVLLGAGVVRAGEPVKVVLPVSMRPDGDVRSNVTTGVSIAVETELRDGVGRVTDLAHIRERSRQEFRALFDGTRVDPDAAMRAVLQVIPDNVARRLAGGVNGPLCLASNLGALDPVHLAPFDGTSCEAVAFRAASLGATRGMLRRMRGGVTTWWNESGERCTLGVRALDPDAIPDVAALKRVVTTVYARWGLTPAFW